MKIVTLTVNPAVDKSTHIDRLIPEQKLRCDTPRFDAGGGGINVSKAIKRLGGKSTAIFTTGGPSGQVLRDLVSQEGIDCEVIQTEQWTRENFIVAETSTNAQYRFGMPGTALSEAETEAVLETLRQSKAEYIVASGSLPPQMDVNFYEKVAAISKEIGARLVLDTSGEPLRAACDEGVFLLKPNIGELEALVGAKDLQIDDVDDAARMLIGDGKCEVVIVSMGPKGAILVTKDLCEHVPAPPVQKRSTVGAGDSMVAGMTWALTQGLTYSEMIRWGVACGSAATMNEGTQLFLRADVERLMDWLKRFGKS
ncbi:1-phosphofructokinase family hexose kinase [Runella sp. SP2]|uniref:1-phosphofructokinase family hexose kinase n=1 Tax=Runella sp. SP2 TaxID=2268026 RepID=UPI000F074AC4|nr:1-phosphofructokinase family hexose kinase [Runella sp. SP2]AYQ33412.1 1-phosphofructokinase family hexose kinase [Runella sp. SP2]